MTDPQLDLFEETAMTAELDAAIRRLLCVCFPKDAQALTLCRAWHNSTPAYSLVCRSQASILGHVAIVIREVLCGDIPVVVAGVQSLVVAPQRRGTGLSRSLMTAAMDEAKRRGIDFGLLFCRLRLERFYGVLGWLRTDEPVIMRDQAGGSLPIPSTIIPMHKSLGAAQFAPGPIDLQGRDW